MTALTNVPIASLPFERFESVLEREPYQRVVEAAGRARSLLDGRVVFNVNSTARGGGVAEMLVSLLAYTRGVGINTRWEVIGGEPEFFALTKRLHNNLHGSPGDGGELGEAERAIYERALRDSAAELAELVKPGDVVILHDPQTAGLVPALRGRGAPVVWRCHVGLDSPSELTRRAWRFLIPYVREADAYVFSRAAFTWEGLDPERVVLIAPSIDAFSAKNQDLDGATVEAILAVAGLGGRRDGAAPTFHCEDGSPERVQRRAEVFESEPLRGDERFVLQVSRWDRLKDPLGVIEGFARHVAPASDAHLIYAGPAVAAVADDPEGAEVLDEAVAAWRALDAGARERIHLACLPMDDVRENAAIVNALQRRADVVVQKSLAEGFGLTVAEAMWKRRPVVASAIGGIQDQIEDGRSGVLVRDPHDLEEFGAAVRGLLSDTDRERAIGAAARDAVRDRFLGVRSLLEYLALVERLLA